MSKQNNTGTSGSANAVKIAAPKGKLGIMTPGMGAVATTFVAGVEAVRRGFAAPIGSLTQMATIRLGKRTDGRSPLIKDFVPLANLDDLVFTGWDIFEDDMYAAAKKAGVLEKELLDKIKPFLETIKPRKAVFDHNYVKLIDGPNVKRGKNKMDLAEQLREDIRDFKKTSGAERLVMIWCGSTESYTQPGAVHQSVQCFEKGLQESHPEIAPSQIYAYAALMEHVPFANGAPNLTVDIPAMLELSRRQQAPIAGKDYKTGQTLMKTILAPGFKARMIGVRGGSRPTSSAIATAKCWKIRAPSKPRKSRSFRCSTTSFNPSSTRRSTRTSATRFASTTTRLAATTKRAGTTSTSLAGWAIRCRSRSISSAATASWPRRWCSIWCSSWTWRNAPGH
jgi:hypothetical protein